VFFDGVQGDHQRVSDLLIRGPDIFSANKPVIQAKGEKKAFQQIPWCEKLYLDIILGQMSDTYT
jgi:hypothetical protein